MTFAERPFCAADNLVISALAYVDLDGIVPGPEGGEITLGEVARALAPPGGPARASNARLAVVPDAVLVDAGRSARFGPARLSAYVDQVDPVENRQFAALTVELPDGTTYVAFRGTDDTILGWQEDFTSSFEVMPAQRSAARYLAERLATVGGPVRVGGHSKGGNLAQYAVREVPEALRERVVRVYDNDGPGLNGIEEEPGSEAELWFADRLERLVPEFAVVGMLFDRGAPRRVVASSARGLLQHDLMTWGVEGTDVVEVEEISGRAALVNAAIAAWLEDAGPQDRREFTEAFFGALRTGGAELIGDIARSEYGSVEAVVYALEKSRSALKRSAWFGLRAAWRTVRETDLRTVVRQSAVVRHGSVVGVGILLLVAPALALPVLLSFGTLVVMAALVWRATGFLWRFRSRYPVTWGRIVVWAVVIVGMLVGLTQVDAIASPASVLLGLALIWHAWVTASRAHRMRQHRPRARTALWLLRVSALVALLLGLSALSLARQVPTPMVIDVGVYLVVSGLVELFLAVQRTARTPVRTTERWLEESVRTRSGRSVA